MKLVLPSLTGAARVLSVRGICATAVGLAAALQTAAPADVNLTHRWSFNGDLIDSVGGQTAQILDADNNAGTGGAATLTAATVNLAGGPNNQSSYVELGSGLLGANSVATLEVWATQVQVQNWGRIFDIGSSLTTDPALGGDGNGDALIMSWTQGTGLNTDRIEYRLGNNTPGGNMGMVGDNTNAPYALGAEYHIVMTLENPAADFTIVSWYSAQSSAADLGPVKGSFTSAIDLAEFGDSVAWLGRSHWSGDSNATANYNEFRTYDTLLNPAELEASHDRGPNVIPEPASLALLGLSGIALMLRRRRGQDART